MSGYTEAIWDDDTAGLRQVMFPTGRLHLAKKVAEANRLGFTVCGSAIPRRSLINEEIPARLQPTPCQRCAAWLARAS